MTRFLQLLLVTVSLGLFSGLANATSVPIMPVSEIEIGMRGIGRTVFQGDTIEEFHVEILGILESSRPHGDLILFRGEGEVLEHAGIIRGMSGSPVYIDGKLIGAVSFAYPMTMDPIGAITPIGEMLDLLTDDLGESVPAEPGTAGTSRPSGSNSEMSSPGWGGREPFNNALRDLFGPRVGQSAASAFTDVDFSSRHSARSPVQTPSTETGLLPGSLQPLTTPMSLSGWAGSMESEMMSSLASLGFAAAATPSGGGMPTGRPSVLEPGASVGVQMISGDADMVGIGTVTYVDDERLVAFGHPMVQSGDVAFPMTGAWIHTVLPNRQVSMKMGSSTDLVGGIWNDRRPGIAGVVGDVPLQMPVRVTIQPHGEAVQEFEYELVRHPFLTPFFLPWTVANSYLTTGWVSGDAYIESDVEVFFDGGRTVSRSDKISAQAPGMALGADITLPAALLLINPWERAQIDSVHVDVRYEPGNRGARMTKLRCSHRRANPGDTIELEVEVEPYRGEVTHKKFDFVIPEAWAGKSLQVHVGGTLDFNLWDQERMPDKFMPHTLDQMIQMIERTPDDSKLTMRIYSPEYGALLQGVELPQLPMSLASASLGQPSQGGMRGTSLALLEERVMQTPWVLTGGETVAVEVSER